MTTLFAGRILGQALVAFLGVLWLPPMKQWFSGIIRYPLLLIVQSVMLTLMIFITGEIWRGEGSFAVVRPRWSPFLIKFSAVYAGLMVFRYLLTMILRSELRWFGDIIPKFFHLVLAAFIFVLGHYHRVMPNA